jgi:hypothetical protein
VAFLWEKGQSEKHIHKKCFSVYSEKCLSREAVHNWVEKSPQGRSKIADDTRPSAELPETTVKILLFCGVSTH